MKNWVLIFGIVLLSNVVIADFVDIVTIKVNNALVRKLTNNSRTPYLINLGKFNIGDTLSIDVWTDHGAERNSFIEIKNEETQHIDTLERREYFIITSDLLKYKHSVVITYIYSYPKEMNITWNICTIIPNNRIELFYENINDLRDFLISTTVNKPNLSSTILNDSVIVNYWSKKLNNDIIQRQVKDTITIALTEIPKLLIFNEVEKSYIQRFNSFDYFQLYDITSDIHGYIEIDHESLLNGVVAFGGYKYKFEFHFKFDQNIYVLTNIYYREY